MVNFFLKNKYLIILLFISIFSYLKWLSFSIFQKSDWNFLFSVQAKELLNPSIWSTNNSFGSIDLTFWRLPIDFFYGILGNYGFNSNVSDVFFVFIPIIILLPLASYLILKKITKSEIGAFVGSIIICFNTYFLAISTQGHIMINVAFVFCIFSIYFFIYAIEDINNKYLYFYSSLFLFVSTFYDLRVSYITIFILFFYAIFYLFIYHKNFFKIIKNSIIFLGISFIIINLYWLIPQFISGSIENNSILNRPLFGNIYWTLEASFNIFHPFWSGSFVSWFTIQEMPLYYWITPILAFGGLILNKKNKNIIFWGVISLLGILLTKQVDIPFINIYPWLYSHFPGFNAFREASKFYILIILGYSVLISSLIVWLWKNYNLGIIKNAIKYTIFILILFIFLWNIKPIITGEIKTMFEPRIIPSDYIIFKDFLGSQPAYFRTLQIPRNSRWVINTNNHPELSDVENIQSNWIHLSQVDNTARVQDKIVNILQQPFSKSLLEMSSIKYVIVPIQDIINDDDFFVDYGGRENPNIRQWYIDQLDKISWLKKIKIGTKDLEVYENSNYKEPIFAFSELYNFESLQNIENKYNFTQKLNNDFYFTSKNIFDKNLIGINNIFENTNLNNGVIMDTIENLNGNVKLYKNLNISNLNKYLFLNDQKIFEGVITVNKEINKFEYKNPNYKFDNIVSNPSFENGMWQEKVGDCHNFDENPILGMNLNKDDKTDGVQSLQLEATRHNACTKISLNVTSGGSYLFSFDYQSPNADHASYYLDFNDKNKTVIKDDLEITDTNWDTFSKAIKVPEGATTVSLYVYADSTDEKTNIINRYDNFKMIQVPDLTDAYYLVSEPEVKVIEPESISFDLINPTKKLVHIKGATTPFFLAMSESYHDKWQLQFNNNKINGFFNSWVPFVKPDKIQDEYHYKLNDFLNAWYIDTNEYCTDNNLCIKNADGSYDMEMTIEFFPQRWFYLGLLISGTTLVGCLGYLGYEGVKSIRIKIKKKHEKDN